jgi:phosphoribosylformylglycinamidine synthase I
MRFGVVRFPGSCDERDTARALSQFGEVRVLWHTERDLEGLDAVVLPGGFSYGDYLRPGALARFAPVMEAVCALAADGLLVLGICNGFQVLCEAGLLPGALLLNASRRFQCAEVELEVENRELPFTCACPERITLLAKHRCGRYYLPEDRLQELQRQGRVVLRYALGERFNGSVVGVAGVANERGNVFGLMPHPEHSVGVGGRSADGLFIFRSLVQAVEGNGGDG